MSNPTDTLPKEDFLTFLGEVYVRAKHVRRTIRLEDDIAGGLGIDSLDALELLVSLEEKYGVALVDSPPVARVETIADLYEVVTAQLADAGGRSGGL